MATTTKKSKLAHDDVEVPDWVLPDDREKYIAAHEGDGLDAAGFGSREEYEARTEMDKLSMEAAGESQPEPRPGDPDYEWASHYPVGVDLFWHTFADGKTVAIRAFGAIYNKQWLYKLRNLPSEADFQFAAIDRAACPTAQEVLGAVDAPIDAPDPFEELWSAWVAAATSHDGQKGLDSGE